MGEDQSRSTHIGEKLAVKLDAAVIRAIESSNAAANSTSEQAGTSRKLLEQNAELCASSTRWIVRGIKDLEDIEFFRTQFGDRLLLVRIDSTETPTPESNAQSDTSVSWSFTFSNNATDPVDEQIERFINVANAP